MEDEVENSYEDAKLSKVKQKMIVDATMCLHNFIRKKHTIDRHFCRCDQDLEYMATIPHSHARHAPP
jgi:hypothetical protein